MEAYFNSYTTTDHIYDIKGEFLSLFIFKTNHVFFFLLKRGHLKPFLKSNAN